VSEQLGECLAVVPVERIEERATAGIGERAKDIVHARDYR
jgi:hypothetical protein